MIAAIALATVIAYLLGSLSFAWIAGRIKGIDLRQHGSGNLGATNAGRVLGRGWFAFVFLGDVLKGVASVLIAGLLAKAWWPEAGAGDAGLWSSTRPMELTLAMVAGAVGACLGHVFTCFHGFKGGKAVATSLGVLIALVPVTAAAGFGLWLVAWVVGAFAFRLGKSGAVGPASMLAALLLPIGHLTLREAPFARDAWPASVLVLLLGIVILLRHRSNFLKLIGRAPPAPPSPSGHG